MAKSLKQQIASRTRQAQCVEMRQRGETYAAIADNLGYATPSAAWKAVQRAVREIGQEEAQTLAILKQERLNDLLAEAWPIATDTSHPKCLQAIDASLKIMDRMNRLAGLVGP